MAAAVPAIPTAVASIIGGATAPRPKTQESGNPVGASQYLDEFQPFLNKLLEGGDAPGMESLLRAFQMQSSNLYGQAQNAGNQGARAGAGAASSMGLSNPLSAMMRGRNQGFNSFAPAFGALAGQQAMAQSGFNSDMLKFLLQGRQNAIGMGGRLSPYARTVGGGYAEIEQGKNSPAGLAYAEEERKRNRDNFGGVEY